MLFKEQWCVLVSLVLLLAGLVSHGEVDQEDAAGVVLKNSPGVSTRFIITKEYCKR